MQWMTYCQSVWPALLACLSACFPLRSERGGEDYVPKRSFRRPRFLLRMGQTARLSFSPGLHIIHFCSFYKSPLSICTTRNPRDFRPAILCTQPSFCIPPGRQKTLEPNSAGPTPFQNIFLAFSHLFRKLGILSRLV